MYKLVRQPVVGAKVCCNYGNHGILLCIVFCNGSKPFRVCCKLYSILCSLQMGWKVRD